MPYRRAREYWGVVTSYSDGFEQFGIVGEVCEHPGASGSVPAEDDADDGVADLIVGEDLFWVHERA